MLEIIEDSVVICPSYVKNKYLSKNHLSNTKFLTLTEFTEKNMFAYKSDTLFYLTKTYNIKPDIAKTMMNNLYYIDFSFNKKTEKLLSIKKDLIENGYIIYNVNFKKYIQNKKIYIVNYSKTKELLNQIKNLNYEYIEENTTPKQVDVYEFPTIDQEVIFVASKIVKLIKEGIDINDIKIMYNSSYVDTINKIFPMFKIPYNLNTLTSLFNIESVKEFLNNLDLSMSVLETEKRLNFSNDINNKIISILNKYTNLTVKDIYEILVFEFKNTFIQSEKYTNCIELIDIYNFDLENKTIFLLGFNNENIPTLYKDEDYLTDEEKEKLNIDTSVDKNNQAKSKLLNIIYQNNIYITYKLETPMNKYTKSSLLDFINHTIKTEEYDFSNEQINKFMFAEKLDNLIKYGVKDKYLNDLYTNTEIPYNTYSNKYAKIDLNLSSFNLSATNMESYFKCPFAFYLNYILKIDEMVDTIHLRIGKFFHKVLEEFYKSKDQNIEEVIDKYIDVYFEKSEKMDFFKEKYKKNIISNVEILNESLSKTEFEDKFFESFWYAYIDDFKIVGRIDKIMTLNNNVVVIDYKSGKLKCDFRNIIHGIDMQLLIYLYLIKKSSLISNPKFSGAYLCPVMLDKYKSEDDKTYADILKENAKLYGYSTSDLTILEKFDSNLDSSFIKGMKINKDGSISATAKVLNKIQINKLLEIIEKNIRKVITAIKESDFPINPKVLNNENISCEYCKFKDICYTTNNDITYLKKYKDLDFLEGEENEVDE